MNDLRAAAQQALEALVAAYQGKDKQGQVTDAITALKAALAEPELNLSDTAVQKRLAAQWGYVKAEPVQEPYTGVTMKPVFYAPRRLADEEIQAIWSKTFESGLSPNAFARRIERAHGIE